jgi:hypothetical protein
MGRGNFGLATSCMMSSHIRKEGAVSQRFKDTDSGTDHLLSSSIYILDYSEFCSLQSLGIRVTVTSALIPSVHSAEL